MQHVAELAGVHPSTVSRALNPATRDMVHPDLVNKVVDAAKKLAYRTDFNAKTLRTGRSKLIGALVPDISSSLFAAIISGINHRLGGAGYSVVIAEVGDDTSRLLELAHGLADHRVDGLILGNVFVEDPLVDFCIDHAIPAVLVNRAESGSRLSAVISDDLTAMQLAVDHLHSLGHRQIAHIAGPQEQSTGVLRRRGFKFALTGFELADSLIEVAVDYSREGGAAAMLRLLDRHPEITAVAAANDLLALGAYDAMASRGLKCPDDISLVGHNDIPHMDAVHPPMTTVRISHKEMGLLAADLLLQAINEPGAARRNIVLPPQLIIRQSTSAFRQGRTNRSAGATART
ncbi:hypothetical protein ASD03_32480 [Ensifer sp. Root127]|nr:hypothetical protein ASD03_32480 [Ensifer sp. Root127]